MLGEWILSTAASTAISTLSVVSINVYGLPTILTQAIGDKSSPPKSVRIEKICQTLKAQARASNWDVILIQEAWAKSDRETLKRCGFAFNADRNDTHYFIDSGLLILSRYPFVQGTVKQQTFKAQGEMSSVFHDGEALARKAILMGKIKHPSGKTLWVADTHLISFYEQAPDLNQSKRILQLGELKRALYAKTRGEPYVLGGDFNSGQEDPKLWTYFKSFNEAPLHSNLCTMRRPELGRCQIDHLFTHPKLKPSVSKLVFTDYRYSDHYGVESQIEF